jgi:hypothetical protein
VLIFYPVSFLGSQWHTGIEEGHRTERGERKKDIFRNFDIEERHDGWTTGRKIMVIQMSKKHV